MDRPVCLSGLNSQNSEQGIETSAAAFIAPIFAIV